MKGKINNLAKWDCQTFLTKETRLFFLPGLSYSIRSLFLNKLNGNTQKVTILNMNDDNSGYPIGDHVMMQQGLDHNSVTGMDNYLGYMVQAPHIPQELLSLLLRTQPSQNNTSGVEFNARGSWTQQEDEQLITAVQRLGAKKWTDIAKFVPTRTAKQCRERWHQRLDPGIRHEPFEPWEDQIIIEKQRELGNHWSLIAQHIKGRCPNSIKNRWYSGLRSQHPTQAQMGATSLAINLPPPDVPPQLMDLGDHQISQLGPTDL